MDSIFPWLNVVIIVGIAFLGLNFLYDLLMKWWKPKVPTTDQTNLSPEEEIDERNPHLITQPAIDGLIYRIIVTVCACVGLLILSFFVWWVWLIFWALIVGSILSAWWILFYFRLIYIRKNTGVVLLDQRNGKSYAVGGSRASTTPGEAVAREDQSGLRLKGSIYQIVESEEDFISLQRMSVDDLKVRVISNTNTRHNVKFSVSYTADSKRLIEYRRIKQKVGGALEASISSLISGVASTLTGDQLNKKSKLQEEVNKALKHPKSADEHQTDDAKDESLLENLRKLWALEELFINIESVQTGHDQRMVEEGVPQAEAITKIVDIYANIKIPPRESMEYLAFLELARTELTGPKGSTPVVIPDPDSVQNHIKRDAIVLAMIKKTGGVIDRKTALIQGNVTANQSIGIANTGGGLTVANVGGGKKKR